MAVVAGMADSEFKGASPNAHFLIGEMPAPAQLKSQWRVLTGGSALPLVVLAICVYIALRVPAVHNAVNQQLIDNFNITWLQSPGPGGGGGGGGNKMPEPSRKAELPGKDKIVVPVTKPPEIKPLNRPKDVPPPPIPAPTIPIANPYPRNIPATPDPVAPTLLMIPMSRVFSATIM